MIDPRISLAGTVPTTQSPRQVVDMFNSILNQSQNRANLTQQMGQSADLHAIKQGVLNNQLEVSNAEQQNLLNAAALTASPENQVGLYNDVTDKIRATSVQRVLPYLNSNDADGASAELDRGISMLTEKGVDKSLIEPLIMAKAKLLEVGGLEQLKTEYSSYLKPKGQVKSAGQREFAEHMMNVQNDPELKTPLGRASSIALRLTPGEGTRSTIERVATNDELSDAVIQHKKAETKAEETAKSKVQLKYKPAIAREIKLAEKAATERGDVLNDLSRAEAGLPGLIDAMSSLKELSGIATSTILGRVWDTAVKETGWGSTKGANARTKYIAIIDNQVLPLLKQTFGAAMTEGEGLRLSNTLGDPNASPEQKILQTDAFIEQKQRDIETLKRQEAEGRGQPVTNGFKILSIK